MQIDIRSNIKDASRFIDEVHRRHIPFASLYAATLTANDVKAEEISTMRRVFDRPTPYVLNAIAARPATKANPVAKVDFDKSTHKGTPAKRFLNPNIHGGPRSQKSSERQLSPLMDGKQFAVPAKGAPVNAYGNMPGSTYTRILSQVGAMRDATGNASDSPRSKRKRKASAFFIPKKGGAIFERKGASIKPVLVFTRAPSYSKRFPFYDVAQATVQRKFPDNFTKALDRAIATSNYKGKWK